MFYVIKRLVYKIAAFIIGILLVTPCISYAQGANIDKIRSLQLFSILKYLSDEDPSATKVCFLGNNNIHKILSVLSAKNPRLKNSELKNFSDATPELTTCNIIYIGSKLGDKKVKSIMSQVLKNRRYVVTISDIPNFIRDYGGTILLSFEDDSPKFALNLKGATDKKYKISSKLIEIADETF